MVIILKKDFSVIPAWTLLFSLIIFAIQFGAIMIFDAHGQGINLFCAVLSWAGFIFIGIRARKRLSAAAVLISSAAVFVLALLQIFFRYNVFLHAPFALFDFMFPMMIPVPFSIVKILRIFAAVAPLGFMLFLLGRKAPQTAEEEPAGSTE